MMVDIQTISIMLASASVIGGVVYYALQIRHQTRIRKTDLVIKLYSTVNTSEFLDAIRKVASLQTKDYEDYVKQYGSLFSESPMHNTVLTVSGFYDFVGILLYRNHIDINLVYDVIGSRTIKMMYEKLKPIVHGARKEFDEPILFAGFEYLHNELLRKEPQLRKTWAKASLPSVSNSDSSNHSSRC
jgi:hypothetical protein